MIQGTSGVLKRMMDVVGAAIGFLLSVPLMVLVAVLIRIDSPGPIIFKQRRVGLFGQEFRVYKFRTMVENAEELLDQLVDLQALDEPVFKIRNDPRVTPIGRFLRRWSLDELPQFLNVLNGDMSLVGPRPEEVRIVQYYNDFHRVRLLAKPGMTGPVQVSGRGDLSLRARVELEIDYIQNYSLGKDLQILLKTIPVVIQGKGSY
jgi:lipopolysaccharide/colanic/teichoic acid biosynthesis glycosyltransferase